MRFPGESARYRASRDRLLEAERDLRRQVEKVAAMRRKLPLGGAVPEDYVFEGASGPVNLSELFRPGKHTLVVYSFMFIPKTSAQAEGSVVRDGETEMKEACPMCTAFIDSLNGTAPHFTQRANLAVVAKSPLGRLHEYARSRGWNNLLLLSSANNTYNRDYFGEGPDGGQIPSLNVFVKRGGKIHHFYQTELVFMPADKGQNQRHIDMAWPLWNLLDFTPEGRGTDWFPQIRYAPSA
jgi:predicted dithiol-disulfide oxidoreductase (DUF899 family)